MSGSSFFPRPVRKAYRPRGKAPSVAFTMNMDPAVKVVLEREAAASGVSLSNFLQAGGLRLADLTRDEREKGFQLVALRMHEEELDAFIAAARRVGAKDLDRWIHSALLDAAARS